MLCNIQWFLTELLFSLAFWQEHNSTWRRKRSERAPGELKMTQSANGRCESMRTELFDIRIVYKQLLTYKLNKIMNFKINVKYGAIRSTNVAETARIPDDTSFGFDLKTLTRGRELLYKSISSFIKDNTKIYEVTIRRNLSHLMTWKFQINIEARNKLFALIIQFRLFNALQFVAKCQICVNIEIIMSVMLLLIKNITKLKYQISVG